jgi:hypothetical protein
MKAWTRSSILGRGVPESFSVFNCAQFRGSAFVDGQRKDLSFGNIDNAAVPRLVQVVDEFTFYSSMLLWQIEVAVANGT